jgi:hypothetical protein
MMAPNIVSADDVLGGGGEPYLDAAAKALLHSAQTPFYITNAIPEKEGNFGPQTIFTIKAKGLEESFLAFQSSASRAAQAKNVLNAIAQGADAVGPVYLGRWENDSGRSGWQLTFAPTTPMTIPATQQQAAQAATTERVAAVTADLVDSDIPF